MGGRGSGRWRGRSGRVFLLGGSVLGDDREVVLNRGQCCSVCSLLPGRFPLLNVPNGVSGGGWASEMGTLSWRCLLVHSTRGIFSKEPGRRGGALVYGHRRRRGCDGVGNREGGGWGPVFQGAEENAGGGTGGRAFPRWLWAAVDTVMAGCSTAGQGGVHSCPRPPAVPAASQLYHAPQRARGHAAVPASSPAARATLTSRGQCSIICRLPISDQRWAVVRRGGGRFLGPGGCSR